MSTVLITQDQMAINRKSYNVNADERVQCIQAMLQRTYTHFF